MPRARQCNCTSLSITHVGRRPTFIVGVTCWTMVLNPHHSGSVPTRLSFEWSNLAVIRHLLLDLVLVCIPNINIIINLRPSGSILLSSILRFGGLSMCSRIQYLSFVVQGSTSTLVPAIRWKLTPAGGSVLKHANLPIPAIPRMLRRGG